MFKNVGIKYHNIIIAIAMFIILDSSILGMNYYISYTLSDDAVAVSQSGRLQMLSQRVIKSIYELQIAQKDNENPQKSFNELKETYIAFDEILTAFTHGGNVSVDNKETVTIKKISDQEAFDIVKKINDVWGPFKNILYPVVAISSPINSEWFSFNLTEAESYAKSNNLTLLELSSELANRTEIITTNKAKTLRLIQTVGIILAIINFLIIIRHFIGQLKKTDEKIQKAQGEMHQILDTVGEGLFLLDKNFVISHEYSRFTEDIFGTKLIAGRKLTDLIVNMVSQEVISTLKKYLTILIGGQVMDSLAKDLNPMSEVKLVIKNALGEYDTKVVSFKFTRNMDDSDLGNILVTIQDVTKLYEVNKKLNEVGFLQDGKLDIIYKILELGVDKFNDFTSNILHRLKDINLILKKPEKEIKGFSKQVSAIKSELHGIKGEAGVVGLNNVAHSVHALETIIVRLSGNKQLKGDDFLPLTVKLKELIAEIEQYKAMSVKLIDIQKEASPYPAIMNSNPIVSESELQSFVNTIADSMRKAIHCSLEQKNIQLIPEYLYKDLRDIAIQLVKNSATHGIEPRSMRRSKPELGRIKIKILATSGEVKLVVKDDGAGIVLDKIAYNARHLSRPSPAEYLTLTKQEKLSLIFESGFSTAKEVSEFAGRGFGMSLVKDIVSKLRGRIGVKNIEGKSCKFIIRIPVNQNITKFDQGVVLNEVSAVNKVAEL